MLCIFIIFFLIHRFRLENYYSLFSLIIKNNVELNNHKKGCPKLNQKQFNTFHALSVLSVRVNIRTKWYEDKIRCLKEGAKG